MSPPEENTQPHTPESRRLRVRLVWLSLWASLFAVVACVAAVAILDRPAIRDPLTHRALARLSDSIVGEVRIGGTQGSIFSRVTILEPSLRDADHVIFEAQRLTFGISWVELLRGGVRLHDVELIRPRVLTSLAEDGRWDFEVAVDAAGSAGVEDEASAGFLVPFSLRLDSISIAEGSLQMTTSEQGTLHLESLALGAKLVARGRQLDLDFSQLHLTARAEAFPPLELSAAGRVGLQGDRVELGLQRLLLATDRSRIVAMGTIAPTHQIDLAIEIEELAAPDVERLIPAYAGFSNAQGRLDLRGPWSETEVTGRLRWTGAELDWAGSVDLAAPDPTTTSGSARLVAPELADWVVDAGLAGRLDASAEWLGSKGNFEAKLGHDRGLLEVSGAISGVEDVTLSGTLQATDLDLSRVLVKETQLASSLGLRGTFRAEDLSASSPRLAFDLELSRSRVGSLEIVSGRLAASTQGDRIALEKLALRTTVGHLDVAGSLGLSVEYPIDLEGRLEVDDVTPLLQLAKLDGRGAVEGTFHATGRVDDLHLEGAFEGTSIAVDEVEAASAELKFELAGVPKLPVRGSVNLRSDGLTLGPFVGDASLRVALAGESTQGVRVELEVAGRDDRHHALVLVGSVDQSKFEGRLDAAVLDSKVGAWRLADPMTLAVDPDRVVLGPGLWQSGVGALHVEGSVARTGEQNLDLAIRGLPIAPFYELAGRDETVEGQMWIDLQLRGSAASPDLRIDLDIDSLEWNGTQLGDARLRSHLVEGIADIEVVAGRLPEHRFDAKGSLPVRLRWDPEFEARANGPLDLSVTSKAFDLNIFAPLLADVASDATGKLDVALRISGPLDDLKPEARFGLTNGSIRPLATEVPIEDLNGIATFAGNALVLESLRGRAGAGSLSISGRAEGNAVGLESISGRLEMQAWPLIKTRAYSLTTTGTLEAEGGDSKSLLVKGAIKIDSGTLRPALEFLVALPPARDPTITYEKVVEQRAPIESGETPEDVAEEIVRATWFERLELALSFSVTNDLWIRHSMAAIELHGDVKVEKSSKRPIELEGTIGTRRGWVNLQGRRFRMVDGRVFFGGGDVIDPQLDMLARYRLPGYTIDARLTGPSSAPSLVLTSDPALEEADVLAVLLFGRPVDKLSAGEEESLENQASSMAMSLGMTAAGRSIANAMGLEEAGLQIDELSQDRASVGAYLGRNTFVSVTQEFREERAQQFSVEYEFWPGWSILTSTTTRGTNAADVIWKVRY